MKSVRYIGPHDGVDVEDAASGFRGSVERGGVLKVPADVAARLIAQGWEAVNDKPAARVAKEN